jgi:hypothetical protein
MGCKMENVQEIKHDMLKQEHNRDQKKEKTYSEVRNMESKKSKFEQSKVEKFSYTNNTFSNKLEESQTSASVETEHIGKTRDVRHEWEQRLDQDLAAAQTNASDFTAQFTQQMYNKQENLSFPELEQITHGAPPPALPPKTKIMNSPSRNIFSPTESIESNGTGTASIKTVEFIPVREKVKLIAAQQEELMRREEASTKPGSDNVKHKGVRILPPSPVTVRKMSVEEELHHYDSVVTRTTPITQLMEKQERKPARPPSPMYQQINSSEVTQNISETTQSNYSMSVTKTEEFIPVREKAKIIAAQQEEILQQDRIRQEAIKKETQEKTAVVTRTPPVTPVMEQQDIQVPGWELTEKQETKPTRPPSPIFHQINNSASTEVTQNVLATKRSDYSTLETRQEMSKKEILEKTESKYAVDNSLEQLIGKPEAAVASTNNRFLQQNTQSEVHSSSMTSEMTSMAISTESYHASMSSNVSEKYVSPAEECRRSFEEAELEAMALETQSSKSYSKQSSTMETASVQSFTYQDRKEQSLTKSKESLVQESKESNFNTGLPVKSNSFIRTPETFTKIPPPAPVSAPATPLSQRRKLKINQMAKPADQVQSSPKYRDGGSKNPFQPGFYRPPPEDASKTNMFQLMKRSGSRSNVTTPETAAAQRCSQSSSHAYDGDSES